MASVPPPLPPRYQVQVPAYRSTTSGMAIASLCLGLVSFVFSILTAIPGIILGFLALQDIKKSAGARTGEGLAIAGICTGAVGGVLSFGCTLALMLPAIQAAREAARSNQAMAQLRQISYAMASFENVNRRFPAIGVDGNGVGPQLSWRVHLLQYLDPESQALYQQFHLAEPWDSPDNYQLISRMPEIYQSPGHERTDGKTLFLAVTGPGTAFQGGQGATARSITDGMANTIMLVEVDEDHAVEWTKPDDWVFDPQYPFHGLGNLRGRVFHAAFFDTHVERTSRDISAAELKTLVTSSGRDNFPQGF